MKLNNIKKVVLKNTKITMASCRYKLEHSTIFDSVISRNNRILTMNRNKTFANILTVLSLVLFLVGCSITDEQNQLSSQKILPQNVVVLIYDISKSTDAYSVLTIEHLDSLYVKIGKVGGGKCYFLFIQSDSRKQEPIQASVPILETLPLRGNAFQQANLKRINNKQIKTFNEQKELFLNVSSKILKPKDEDFSDVENAFILAKIVLENPDYKTWSKYLIICSDCENDFSPKNGIDEMNQVGFQKDVKIAVVRVSQKIDFEKLLPGAGKYITVEDALNTIKF